MKIAVIGTGYVGLVAGVCFADFGHNVICLDTDAIKINKLNAGICPIYEPGANEMLIKNMKSGRLAFTTAPKDISDSEAVFLAVGTPESIDGQADLSYVLSAAKMIADNITHYTVVVDKSTVPVGTSEMVAEVINSRLNELNKSVPFSVVSNPEFLREGKALGDFLNPDRIVIGASDDKALTVMKKIYSIFERSNKPIIYTTPKTAELIKYASNAFLATKIAYINEIANLCEKVGADVKQVAAAMGKDGRIGPKFLHAGPGYGGSCFPKDTKAIAALAREQNTPLTIVESVIAANELQKEKAAEKIKQYIPNGGSIAVLGLSFKPETDDVRESPAIAVVKNLMQNGKYRLYLYDPQAMSNAQTELNSQNDENIIWCDNAKMALQNANAVALLTEWAEFRTIDYIDYDNIKTIFDFRNIYSEAEMHRDDIMLIKIGRQISK